MQRHSEAETERQTCRGADKEKQRQRVTEANWQRQRGENHLNMKIPPPASATSAITTKISSPRMAP